MGAGDEVNGVDNADDGGVNGRVGTADGSHGGEAFGDDEDLVADAGVHGVKSEDGLAAVGAVQMQGLDDEDLPAVVGRRFLGGDDVADDAADQHQAVRPPDRGFSRV